MNYFWSHKISRQQSVPEGHRGGAQFAVLLLPCGIYPTHELISHKVLAPQRFYSDSLTSEPGGDDMRDARYVDTQLFQPDIPMRLDMRTAALVEHALALQEMAGTGAAALFLHCHDVPLPTALRVLTTGPRRKAAGPHLFARLRPRTAALAQGLPLPAR